LNQVSRETLRPPIDPGSEGEKRVTPFLQLRTLLLAGVLSVALALGLLGPGVSGAGAAQPPTVGETAVQAAAAGRSNGLVYAEGERLMLDGQPFIMNGSNYLPRGYGWMRLDGFG